MTKIEKDATIEELVACSISLGVWKLRESTGLSQEGFAKRIGKTASWISRLEDPNAAPPTVSTLLAVAKGFGMALDFKFTPLQDFMENLRIESKPSAEQAPAGQPEIGTDGQTVGKGGVVGVSASHYSPTGPAEKQDLSSINQPIIDELRSQLREAHIEFQSLKSENFTTREIARELAAALDSKHGPLPGVDCICVTCNNYRFCESATALAKAKAIGLDNDAPSDVNLGA